MPSKSSFMAENYPGAMGYLSLISVEQHPSRYRYRIFSERIYWSMKLNRMIRSIDDAEPEEYRALLRAQFDEVVEERFPILHEVRYATERERVCYKRLCLPLGDDTSRVSHLLCLPVDRSSAVLDDAVIAERRPYGIA